MENLSSNLIKQYTTIGRINTVIANSRTVDEAVREGLKEILKGLDIEYAVIWYQDKDGDKALHPYFWIAPVDLTKKYHLPGQGITGQVFNTQKAINILDYQNHKDAETDRDFEGIAIASMVCVPLSEGYNNLGCVQFINTTDHHLITEDEAGICDILCLMAAAVIDEKMADFSWKNRNTVMRVKNICKVFQNGDLHIKVLKDMNLDIYEGEFLVILGESGCGKTTLMNILGGLDHATSGTCTYYGEEITSYSRDQLTGYRRAHIGFIFQSYNLMSNLTAKQNLDLIGELVEDPMDSMEALRLVGLEDKSRSYPFQLSGGQQQRVSIARALVKRPKLILADEPTAALDYATSIEVLKVLQSVMQTGTTLVMVTHNEEISRMADRVVRLRNGRIYEVTINKHPAAPGELVW